MVALRASPMPTFPTLPALALASLLWTGPNAHAGTAVLDFSSVSFAGALADITPEMNASFASQYGASFTNAYLFRDGRLQAPGAANGTIPAILAPEPTTQQGVVRIIEGSSFLSVRYVAAGSIALAAWAMDGSLIERVEIAAPISTLVPATLTFNAPAGRQIGSFSFTGLAGSAGILGLQYEYDGITDGTGHPPVIPAVPEPSTAALLGLALAGFAVMRLQRRASPLS